MHSKALSDSTPLCVNIEPTMGGFSGILKGQYGLSNQMCTDPNATLGQLSGWCRGIKLPLYAIDGTGIDKECFYQGPRNQKGTNGVACVKLASAWCSSSTG